MPAPKGNQFWKQRSKHGRDKLFASPELLWDAACEYFQWCEDNPLKEQQIVKFKAHFERVEVDKMRPFTLQGLAGHLGCSTEYFRHFEENNKDSKDFMPIIARIRDVIYQQKFEGAASGFFAPNIIARDLGLVDKKDHTTDGDKITGTDEELRAKIASLEKVVNG